MNPPDVLPRITVDVSARIPLSVRLRLAVDRDLGVGNFLDRVCAHTRRSDRPFLFAQRPASHPAGPVEPFSLDKLTRTRDAYAAWYHTAGVGKGDPVAVYVDNGIDPFLHFLAVSSLGAVAALINGRMPAPVAAEYITRIGAVGVVATADRLDALRRHGIGTRWMADHDELSTVPMTNALPPRYPYPHADDDPVMLCHTSGTTGPPKAATFGHRQFFLGKRQRLWNFPAASRNRLLSALPQSHSAGISYLMTATLLGLPTLVMADSSGQAVHQAMAAFRPSMVVAFPETYAELAEMSLDPSATTDIHTWINTGDSAHEAHIRALIRHGRRPGRRGGRPGSRFVDGLGSSEMGMALFRKVSEPESADYGRCVGTPIGVVREAAVLDDAGRLLGPHQPGRLGVRTPTRTAGYWNDSATTNRSSISGYWLTGDVVYRDETGKFYHLDRVPDVIHTSGGPVYSLPLEEAILVGCPQIADCAVVAVRAPGPETGDVPFAAVKLAPGAAEPDDLLATVNSALAARDLPTLRAVAVATDPADFPTGPTGKVLKRQLRQRFSAVLQQPVT
ncbi:class I adenylate-forming enzyme family protein [Solwaraspora sp. WMMD791]|uniref:AMP-binding protein n=1 Tax=Solwaraspora sp. WMMD791 TaxID=3016086 RepID=UPI00249C5BF4|nr:class I adenylate-forming enzyme family protein [Solwaraspora sp. WMMD791]WFE30117.1 class I adenylate-forming enzyme family protein [Solwaraspora sp. WMMD791]